MRDKIIQWVLTLGVLGSMAAVAVAGPGPLLLNDSLQSGGTLTGPLLLPAGSAAAPGLAGSADPTTGMRFYAAGSQIIVSGAANMYFTATDTNLNLPLDMLLSKVWSSSGILELGTSMTTSQALGAGDVGVGGDFEVDGFAYFEANSLHPDGSLAYYGTGNDFWIRSNSGNFSIGSQLSGNMAYQSLGEDHIRFYEGGTLAKGAYTSFRTIKEDITFDGTDPQPSSTNLLVDGGHLTHVTGRVVTALTGCATFDIGLTGGDTDIFAAGISGADTTTFDATDATATYGGIILADDTIDVKGNAACTGGVLRITAHYFSAGASTLD